MGMLESEENAATGGRGVLVPRPAHLCRYHEQAVRRTEHSRAREARPGQPGTQLWFRVGPAGHLREFLGSPGPMLTCSTLLLGLRMARSPKPWWNCTCREPPALQGPQFSFFNLTSSLQQVCLLELTSQNGVLLVAKPAVERR